MSLSRQSVRRASLSLERLEDRLVRIDWFPVVIVGLYALSHLVPTDPNGPNGPAPGWVIPYEVIRRLHEDLQRRGGATSAPAGVARLLPVLALLRNPHQRTEVILALPILLLPAGLAALLACRWGRPRVAGAVAALAGLLGLACAAGAVADTVAQEGLASISWGFLALPGCYLWAASMGLLAAAGIRKAFPQAASRLYRSF